MIGAWMRYTLSSMKVSSAFAPGKIILSGEYAVVFGYPGIAVPVPIGITVTLEESTSRRPLSIVWKNGNPSDEWQAYLKNIIHKIEKHRSPVRGLLIIDNHLPLGKGMGSSTALIIATCRCLLGENCQKEARMIEDTLNPGHSGIDFAVIWMGCPVKFVKGQTPVPAMTSLDFLKNALLIDTGSPRETTPELVAWVKSRENECASALKIIGQCTERLVAGEDPMKIIPEHHRAQVALGVVPKKVQSIIEKIEATGGVAKVIGAGARTGGGGMVLALGVTEKEIRSIDAKASILSLR